MIEYPDPQSPLRYYSGVASRLKAWYPSSNYTALLQRDIAGDHLCGGRDGARAEAADVERRGAGRGGAGACEKGRGGEEQRGGENKPRACMHG